MEDCCFCGILWKVGVSVWCLVAVSVSVECQVEGLCICGFWWEVVVSSIRLEYLVMSGEKSYT